MINMRSLHRCIGCGDLLYVAAAANYEGKHPGLDGLELCPDARRAKVAPKLSCARAAARADRRFEPLVTELESLGAQSKARWDQVARRALGGVAVLAPVSGKVR